MLSNMEYFAKFHRTSVTNYTIDQNPPQQIEILRLIVARTSLIGSPGSQNTKGNQIKPLTATNKGNPGI